MIADQLQSGVFMRLSLAVLAAFAVTPALAQHPPPEGSYASRCEDVHMRGSILRATCRASSGASRESWIDTLACRGRDIGVSDSGELLCPGGGRPTIILYTGTVWRGQWRAVSGDVADLARVGMNDRVRSIEMNARSGAWEICGSIDFGGRCETLTTSVPDTGQLGLANNVSSVRRVPAPE